MEAFRVGPLPQKFGCTGKEKEKIAVSELKDPSCSQVQRKRWKFPTETGTVNTMRCWEKGKA